MIVATANYLAADAKLTKRPIFVITIADYTRAFSNFPGVTGVGATVVDWLIAETVRGV